METKLWVHKNVTPNGVLKSGGAVKTNKEIKLSELDCCRMKYGNLIDFFWVSVNLGYDRKRKSVSGITFYFENKKEYSQFLRTNKDLLDCLV